MSPPEVWGPPVWNFIHTLAEKVNEDSFNIIKVSLLSIIKRICLNLPCPECSQHANFFFMKVNILKIHSKSEFRHMLFVFHNAVNKRKRKPLAVYTSIMDRYKFMTIPNTYNNFINVYNTKGNLNLIMESFQRSFVLKELDKWLYQNHAHFKSKPTPKFINMPKIIQNDEEINNCDKVCNIVTPDIISNSLNEKDDEKDDEVFKSIINNEIFNIDEETKEEETKEELPEEETKEELPEEETKEEETKEEEPKEEPKEEETKEELPEEDFTEKQFDAITESSFESIDEECLENINIPTNENNIEEIVNLALEIINSYKEQDK